MKHLLTLLLFASENLSSEIKRFTEMIENCQTAVNIEKCLIALDNKRFGDTRDE